MGIALAVVGVLSFPHEARAQGVETIIEWNRILWTRLGEYVFDNTFRPR
jgi:hypothetical protein